jgi:DNA-binding NtrC family response regulator
MVPAIMVTGYPSIYSASRSKELGAFDYLTKPIEISELNAAVERALASAVIK